MKKQFIKIESTGIIDPKAFSLIGASTKRNDSSKIGFFGSGLKYSIAYLLRNKINFKVFADYEEIHFETVPTNFREQDFEVIHVNGKETSMTTQMGIDWQAWYIIREIYCNALDEGEAKINVVSTVQPMEDKTVFYIEINEEFDSIIKEWDLYFSLNRKNCLYSNEKGDKVFNPIQGKRIVYRKGIQCCNDYGVRTLFSYDFNEVEINESRVIKSEYQYKCKLTEFLCGIQDGGIIMRLIAQICTQEAGQVPYEYDMYWANHEYSLTWLKAVEDYILVPFENGGFWAEEIATAPEKYIIIPTKIINGLSNCFGEKINVIGGAIHMGGDSFKEVKEMTPRQQSLLDESIEFLKKCDYEITHPIKIVEFQKSNVLGRAYKGEILLSSKLFENGRKQIVACIIEEQEHLVTGFEDKSRAFQSHFINKLVTIYEEKTGIYL
jgi:hypothetical protein